WLAQLPGARRAAAGYQLLYRISKAYEKPEFGILAVEAHGDQGAVREETVVTRPFCHLKHFRRSSDRDEINGALRADPTVLAGATLAGQHAPLLRGPVRTVLGSHDGYIPDWLGARVVPVAEGAFTLNDYVGYVREFIQTIGAARLHV